MTTTTRNLGIALIVGIILGIIVYVGYQSRSGTIVGTDKNATTTTQGSATSTGQLSVEEQAAVNEALANLDIQKMIAEARALKNAGNYDAAIAKLNQAVATFPGNTVAYNNLADIYLNFKKDYSKAELNYKKVIQNDPRMLDAYRQLFQLYTTTNYKPTNTAAVDIANAALKQEPKAYDFQLLLARYYKGMGDNASAKVQYQAAIANAEGQGLSQVAASIRTELNQLPQ